MYIKLFTHYLFNGVLSIMQLDNAETSSDIIIGIIKYFGKWIRSENK